jgi:hypothetical protein
VDTERGAARELQLTLKGVRGVEGEAGSGLGGGVSLMAYNPPV